MRLDLTTDWGGVTQVESQRWISRISSRPSEPPPLLYAAFSPLSCILPERATPEMQRLQAKLCATMPYRQAAAIMRSV